MPIIVDRLRDLEQRGVGMLRSPGFPVCPHRGDRRQRLAFQGTVHGLADHLGPVAAGFNVLHHHVFAVKLAGNEEGQGLAVDASRVNERRLAQATPGDGDRLAAQDVVNHMMIGSGKHVERVSTRLALELDSDDVILVEQVQTGVKAPATGTSTSGGLAPRPRGGDNKGAISASRRIVRRSNVVGAGSVKANDAPRQKTKSPITTSGAFHSTLPTAGSMNNSSQW